MKKLFNLIVVFAFGLLLVACTKTNEPPIVEEVDYDAVIDLAKSQVSTKLESGEVSANYFLLDQQIAVSYEEKSYTVTIVWVSNSERVTIYPNEDLTLTANAIVVRPQAGQPDASVKLTATLSIEDKTRSVEFDITVKAFPTYTTTVMLPDTAALPNVENAFVVEDAPELLILGIVLDTFHYFHYETMSGYEYVKVYNNTNEPYNMKNHRIALASPMQGQNYENADSKLGNEVLSTGYLFMSIVDEDFIIQPLSTALIWLKPYNWIAGSGTNAFNKEFSSALVHVDTETQKGAFSQTEEDFRIFWQLDENIPVWTAENMPLIGKRPEGGTSDFFPILSPGAGTAYTHLNSTLLRSLEISKFNDQNGTAEINILNDYDELTPEKRLNPDLIWTKPVFNAIEIKDNNELVDAYFYQNAWKYFDPIVRANFTGRIDTATLDTNSKVSFSSTSNLGIKGWENTVEIQFRPPVVGERLMQLQLLVREYTTMINYLNANELSIMRYSSQNIAAYKLVEKTIVILVDMSQEGAVFNPRTDELWSEGRISGAAPNEIKIINLTRP